MKITCYCIAMVFGLLMQTYGQSVSRHDILITEFFTNPQPVVSLPASEFIELTNCSEHTVDLKGWTISDLTSATTIKTSVLLDPGQSIILCPVAASDSYTSFGLTLGITGFPSLNNDADQIILKDPGGSVIHALHYTKEWLGNGLKAEGGWTLEMIDLKNPCGGKSNWKESSDISGGTPGKQNSVMDLNPDLTAPMLIRSYVQDSLNIVLQFDEPLDSLDIHLHAKIVIDNYSGSVLNATSVPPFFSTVVLNISEPLQNNKIYSVSVNHIRDCAGNTTGTFNKARTGIAALPNPGQIIINEILFNPKSGGADYIELFHRGNEILDLAEIYLSNGPSDFKRLVNETWLIFPGDYIVFSPDIKNIAENYPIRFKDNILELKPFPSFPDDRGKVILSDRQGNSLDILSYSDDWHSPLVKEADGVALERIDPEIPTEHSDNWTSASSLSGYGTPGYQNSQFKLSVALDGELTIDPPVISPDSDGWQDFTTIQYQTGAERVSGSITVFDASGREVNRLLPNGILGNSGRLNWHGNDSKLRKLPVGLYIISMRIFDLSGRTRKFLRPVVIAK